MTYGKTHKHQKEVCKIIEKLNPHKAPELDIIKTKIIWEFPKNVTVLLTYVFNAIIRLRYFPQDWKIVKIITIPKRGKPLEFTKSYRLILFLQTFLKIFENNFYQRLEEISNKFDIESQFGFRSKQATTEVSVYQSQIFWHHTRWTTDVEAMYGYH